MEEQIKKYLNELKTIKEKQLKGHYKAIEMIENVYKDIDKMDDESKRIYDEATKNVEILIEDIENLNKIL